jgi:hypothetical protein
MGILGEKRKNPLRGFGRGKGKAKKTVRRRSGQGVHPEKAGRDGGRVLAGWGESFYLQFMQFSPGHSL